MKITKKIVAILMLLILMLSSISNIIYAAEISEANLIDRGNAEYHLQYWNSDANAWYYVITAFVTYEENGRQYPAYCLNREFPGVGGQEGYDSYTVDITSVIDDVRVWRTIINGYPYKSAAELGVANDYEAFQATKQAVYCIIYNFNPYTMYRSAEQGADARGAAIRQAIINMVDVGRNGTQTPYTAGISASKVGELKKDGNYYSQEYKVDCGIQVSEFAILSTAGMPTGAIITDMNGTEKTTFTGNENFKIKIPASQMASDINITFNVVGKAKTYPIFYGKTRIPGTQNYAVTYDPLGDVAGIAKLNVKTNTGKIQINKTDDETKQPISGVTFTLTKEDGTVVANATTNEKGIATFSSLYQGKYKLKETQTNEKYILNNQEFDVNVEYNSTITKDIENEHKKGNVKVYKIDKDNKRVVLGNVEFDLYSHEFKKVIGTYNTDVNGELEVKDLRIGDYSFIEKKTNRWYNLAEDTDIKVEWELTKELQIENELKKGQLRIIKVDLDDNEVKLEGVKFGIYDSEDNLLETIITDENGEALTKRYPVRDFDKLKIVEEETKEEYVLNDKPQTIVLKENEIKNITFENEKIKGKLEIEKVDSKDKNKKLSGVEFGIYDENDNLVQKMTTNDKGIAESDVLFKDNYYVKELKAQSEYYLLNDKTYEFEIVKHKETIKKQIENEPVEIEVTVDKEGTTEIKPGEKVNYEFSNVGNSSNIYLENFKWFDYIPTDYIRLEKMTTGTWNQDLNYSVYYKTNKSDDYVLFKENLNTKENYELDFTTIEFTDDEYIIETSFDFGKVDVGFKEDTKPTMECKSFDTLKKNDTFTNHTKTVGVYFGVTAEANSKWTTITNIPEKCKEPVLPRTGK